MTLYVDVAVIRIQHYLGRWPLLRGQRGGSRLVTDSTEDHAVKPVLDHELEGPWRLHDEAGRADGVVHLEIQGGTDPQEAAHAIKVMFSHLRNHIPAAEFHAGWALAGSYADAAPAMHQMVSGGGTNGAVSPTSALARTGEGLGERAAGSSRSLPSVAELPILERCQLCRMDIAAGEKVKLPADEGDDGERAACRDCQARHRAAQRMRERGGVEAAINKAERRLIRELELRPAWTFEKLAQLGPGVRDLHNHLATVRIDGNAMGAFFNELQEKASGPEARQARNEISKAISQATEDALVHAAHGIKQADDEYLPVIPHIVGGDDVTVSLPAKRAWSFVRLYLAKFEEITALAVQEHVPRAVKAALPASLTASAGIGFAHTTYPFASVCELSEDALKLAKRMCPGKSAISWVDHTREGDKLPEGRQVFPLDQVAEGTEPHAVLQQLASAYETQDADTADERQTAAEKGNRSFDPSRLHALEAAASGDDGASASARRARLRRELGRLGVEDPAFSYLAWDVSEVPIDRAVDVLLMARWWS